MKRYRELLAVIADSVNAEFVGHIRYRVCLVVLLRYHSHRLLASIVGHLVSNLSQVSLQDLHEAVSVAVVVDGTPLSRSPYK